jgi:hypothetical protein
MPTYYRIKLREKFGQKATIVSWHGPRKTMPTVKCDDGTILDVTWRDLAGPINESERGEEQGHEVQRVKSATDSEGDNG